MTPATIARIWAVLAVVAFAWYVLQIVDVILWRHHLTWTRLALHVASLVAVIGSCAGAIRSGR